MVLSMKKTAREPPGTVFNMNHFNMGYSSELALSDFLITGFEDRSCDTGRYALSSIVWHATDLPHEVHQHSPILLFCSEVVSAKETPL
jgi:hypothetical protein